MLFDLVMVAVTVLFRRQRRGRRSAVTAAAVTVLLAGFLIGAALMVGGPRYLHGIAFTTFDFPFRTSADTGYGQRLT